MADASKTVNIIFGSEDNLSPTVKNLSSSFGALEAGVGQITGPLSKVADYVIKADAALAAMVIGGMALAIKASGDFNNKFGEISTLIKDTGAPIDKFKTDIINYSTSSVKSIDQINQAVYTAISAGASYDKSLELVHQAEMLSVAGRSELGITTKVLVSTLNAYGASTQDAGKYSDIMFTTVKLGLTTMSELASSLAMVTGLAANSGIPFATLSAAIAALTAAGLPTSQAITGLRQVIENIIKPSGEAATMAATLGLQFDSAALKTKGLEGVLWDAYKATGGNIGQMGKLFGSVEGLNAVMILGKDATGSFKNALTEMGNSAGATGIAYDKIANSFENTNQRLKNNIEATLITIGDKMMPAYGKMAGGLEDLFKGIKVGVDAGAFDPLFAAFDEAGGKLASLLGGIAKALPEAMQGLDFSGLLKSFSNLGETIGKLFTADLTDPKQLHDVLQEIINDITGLVEITNGMAKVFVPMIEQFLAFANAVSKGDEKSKETLGSILALASAAEALGIGMLALVGALKGSGADITAIWKGVTGTLQLEWNGLMTVWDTAKLSILDLAYDLATAAAAVEALFNVFATDKTTYWKDQMDTISKKMSEVEKDLVADGLGAAAGLSKIGDAFKGAGDDAEKLKTKVATIPAAINEIPKDTTVTINGTVYTQGMDGEIKAWKQEQTDVVIKATVAPDIQSADSAYGMLVTQMESVDNSYGSEPGIIVITQTKTDIASVEKTNKDIKDKIPAEKQLEIKTKLDEAQIKAQSEIIQKSVEWKAKIDIAQIEASAAVIKQMFTSVDNTITNSGNLLGEYAKSFAAFDSAGHGGDLLKIMQDENALRKDALEMQKELVKAQIAQIDALTKAMNRGEGLIKIDGTGLAPHLEAFMYSILSAIQVRASAEGMKFLVGV